MKKSYHSSELPTRPAARSRRHSRLLTRDAPACSAMMIPPYDAWVTAGATQPCRGINWRCPEADTWARVRPVATCRDRDVAPQLSCAAFAISALNTCRGSAFTQTVAIPPRVQMRTPRQIPVAPVGQDRDAQRAALGALLEAHPRRSIAHSLPCGGRR